MSRAARPAAAFALLAALIVAAGCARPPVPCATAGSALQVRDVAWNDGGFRVTIVNASDVALAERVFVEVAVVQGGRPVLAGSTATAASWPAAGTATVTVPFAVDARPIAGPSEIFTHLKCLSPTTDRAGG